MTWRFGDKDRCGLCYCEKETSQCAICLKWLCAFCFSFHPAIEQGNSHKGEKIS